MKGSILCSLLVYFFGLIFFNQSGFAQATHVVISEVYGGGGNAGATYTNDYIELYNPTNVAVDLTTWSVQYSASTGTSWQKTNLAGILAPGKYYLIQEAVGTGGSVNLPAPDAIGTISMAAGAGKVALVSNQTILTGSCPSGLVDLVGFGTAICFEGTGGTPVPSATFSVERKANASSTSSTMGIGGLDEFLGNGYDSDNNAADFATRFPQPQNTLSSIEPDVTAPTFSVGSPSIGTVAETQFELIANMNETGKIYYVVLPDGASAPASSQVKAGLDDGGTAVSVSGQLTITNSAVDFTKTITSVQPSTAYDVYVVAEDTPLNLQSSPVKLDVTTHVSTAPILSPFTSAISFPGFTHKSKQSAAMSYSLTAGNLTEDVIISVTGNFLISTDNVNYGTSLSIDKTLFAGNTIQTIYAKFSPAENTGSQTGTITNSSAGATDKLIALAAVSIDPFNQNFNDPAFLSNSGWTQYSKIGAQIWATTNFGHTCLTGCTSGTVDKAAQINGFSGSAQNNEDWLISPPMDLTEFVNYPALSFWTISAFAGDILTLKYSTDYPGTGDPALATWTSMGGKFPMTNSSLWTKSSNIILPKSVLYVAVVYTSNTTAASRWTFDDWKVEDISSYLDVPTIAWSFGEIVAGNQSSSQSFAFSAVGYGDITMTVPAGFEISTDNSSFGVSKLVTQSEALAGKTLYVRFSPNIKKIAWTGAINLKGTSLDANYGTLTGSSYPRSETFDVTTWNLEFFGTDVRDASNVEFGPTDDALQVANATTVLQTLGSDIFGVEEIADDNAFDQLLAGLPGYNKIVSDRWSYSFDPPDPNFPPQKVGFIYNSSTVQWVSSRAMFVKMYNDIKAGTVTLPAYPGGTSSSFWSSGRLPFMATFDVTIGGIKKRIHMIDIHAKSGSAQADYDRRKYDVQVLYDSLVAQYANENIIIVGDFNDDVDTSIKVGSPSSYKFFVDDAVNYNVLTLPLSLTGASSFPSSTSFIDHIVISDELNASYISSSTFVEDPRNYISNYSNTTSDHLPLNARFQLVKTPQAITFTTLPAKTFGDAPFNLSAASSSALPVTFTSSDPSIASVSGNTVTLLKAGNVNIIASQAGNSEFSSAIDVVQPLVINKASQTITFGALSSKTLGDAIFSLTATASSTLTVSFSTTSDKITLSGSQVTLVKSGRAIITAAQAGNGNYSTATSVDQSFCIKPAKPTITVFNPNLASPTLTSSALSGNQWYLNASAIAGATGITLRVISAGTYKVQAKTDDCFSDFSTDIPVVVTGDLELNSAKVIVVPNPVRDYLEVTGLKKSDVESQVIDMTGRSVPLTLERQDQRHRANVDHLSSGIYLLRVYQEGVTHQLRFIKK